MESLWRLRTTLLLAVVAISASAQPAADNYLFARLISPDIPLPVFQQSLPRPDEHRSWGPARVRATQMVERVQLSGLRVERTHLRIGALLGSLRVGELEGWLSQDVSYPVLRWRNWRPHTEMAHRTLHSDLFRLRGVGVGLVSKRPLTVALPPRIELKVTCRNDQLHWEIINRKAIHTFLEAQVDSLLDPAWAKSRFRSYLINKPTSLDSVLDAVFQRFHQQVMAEVRRTTKERLLSTDFIDNLLAQLTALLPPLRLRPDQSATLILEREVQGSTRGWTVVYSPAGALPSPELLGRLPLENPDERSNRMQFALTPSFLVHLVNLAISNFAVLKEHVPYLELPPEVTVDVARRRLLFTPASPVDQEGLLLLFRQILPGRALPSAPVLAVGFPEASDRQPRFRNSPQGALLDCRLLLSLWEEDDPRIQTPEVPVDLTFLVGTHARVEVAKIHFQAATPDRPMSENQAVALLRRIGPGVQTLLLRGMINERIRRIYAETPELRDNLERVLTLELVEARTGDGVEAVLKADFHQPLAFPEFP